MKKLSVLDNIIGSLIFFVLVVVPIVAVIYFCFNILTDRICDKPYSPEFKQTQQYKDMQCPNSTTNNLKSN